MREVQYRMDGRRGGLDRMSLLIGVRLVGVLQRSISGQTAGCSVKGRILKAAWEGGKGRDTHNNETSFPI